MDRIPPNVIVEEDIVAKDVYKWTDKECATSQVNSKEINVIFRFVDQS